MARPVQTGASDGVSAIRGIEIASARRRLRSAGSASASAISSSPVNDQAAAICNRERWQVVEVDPAKGSAVLHGIDQPRTVEVGVDYLPAPTRIQRRPRSNTPMRSRPTRRRAGPSTAPT